MKGDRGSQSTVGKICVVFVVGVLDLVAQLERDLIRERTCAGLEAVCISGRKGCCSAKLDWKQIKEVQRLHESRTVTVDQIAVMMNVGHSIVYRCLRDNRPV